MCKQRSVASISNALASELGVTFQDNHGNKVISMQLAAQLDPSEFTVIAANYTEGITEGILPINPGKPIVRPKI